MGVDKKGIRDMKKRGMDFEVDPEFKYASPQMSEAIKEALDSATIKAPDTEGVDMGEANRDGSVKKRR